MQRRNLLRSIGVATTGLAGVSLTTTSAAALDSDTRLDSGEVDTPPECGDEVIYTPDCGTAWKAEGSESGRVATSGLFFADVEAHNSIVVQKTNERTLRGDLIQQFSIVTTNGLKQGPNGISEWGFEVELSLGVDDIRGSLSPSVSDNIVGGPIDEDIDDSGLTDDEIDKWGTAVEVGATIAGAIASRSHPTLAVGVTGASIMRSVYEGYADGAGDDSDYELTFNSNDFDGYGSSTSNPDDTGVHFYDLEVVHPETESGQAGSTPWFEIEAYCRAAGYTGGGAQLSETLRVPLENP